MLEYGWLGAWIGKRKRGEEMMENTERVELVELQQKIAGLEKEVQNQRRVIQVHLEYHEQENEELKKIINNIKEELYKGVAQTL